MDELSPSVSTRRGTPGLDIFKIAGRSISGFLPSFKTGNERQIRQPFTTQLEERLTLYLAYHPHVRTYHRGDTSEAFVGQALANGKLMGDAAATGHLLVD